MSKGKEKAKGGNFLSALCRILGILFILAVILTCIPLTIPSFLGYEVFNVESGSMAPEIPEGSVVYAEKTAAEEVQSGDVICFYREEVVITHRVLENRIVEGEFITKGDANDTEDLAPIPYSSLIGVVVKHIPYIGKLLIVYSSLLGKIYVLAFAACGVMLNILGSMLKKK